MLLRKFNKSISAHSATPAAGAALSPPAASAAPPPGGEGGDPSASAAAIADFEGNSNAGEVDLVYFRGKLWKRGHDYLKVRVHTLCIILKK